MIKYSWNFHGKDGKGTASHHRIHLEGFAATHNIPFNQYKTGQIDLNENHSVSFIEVPETLSQLIEDLLKPHEKAAS